MVLGFGASITGVLAVQTVAVLALLNSVPDGQRLNEFTHRVAKDLGVALEADPNLDVQRYIDFFARPGGVKADPSDVILASINAPPTPVGTLLTMPCADQVNTPVCPILNHSCVDAANPMFFGDPAVRISAVVDAALTAQRTSMCQSDYSSAVDALAQSISARLR